MKHVVMFSSGTASWAAARRVADEHGTDDMVLLFSDVKGNATSPHLGEDEDNYRFLQQAADDLAGAQLVRLAEGRDVWQVFKDQRFIGNTRVSNCSRTLKQQPARHWLAHNADPNDTTVYVGIDWTETHRLPVIRTSYRPFLVKAPLCDPPYLTRDDIHAALEARGIKPPRLYEMGFVHSNCGGFCVRAGQGHFKQLYQVMPERYRYHEQREQEIRDYLGKDVAILRDRRGGTTRPLTLRELRTRIEAAEEVDADDIGGCGCFTDELDDEIAA